MLIGCQSELSSKCSMKLDQGRLASQQADSGLGVWLSCVLHYDWRERVANPYVQTTFIHKHNKVTTRSYARPDIHTAGCVTSYKILYEFMLSLSSKANVPHHPAAYKSKVQSEITRLLGRESVSVCLFCTSLCRT